MVITRHAALDLPERGREFVIKNICHSCSPFTVEIFLEGKDAFARGLFDRFEAMIAQCSPYAVSPAKTRVRSWAVALRQHQR